MSFLLAWYSRDYNAMLWHMPYLNVLKCSSLRGKFDNVIEQLKRKINKRCEFHEAGFRPGTLHIQ